jgi:hypothetical protein
MIRVETVLDSWKTIRNDTALAVEDFPAAALDFRATPDSMTFGDTSRPAMASPVYCSPGSTIFRLQNFVSF